MCPEYRLGGGRMPAASSPPSPACALSLQRLQSGSTGVCALIAGNTLHVAWLGDSQVLLVQQGQAVKLSREHFSPQDCLFHMLTKTITRVNLPQP